MNKQTFEGLCHDLHLQDIFDLFQLGLLLLDHLRFRRAALDGVQQLSADIQDLLQLLRLLQLDVLVFEAIIFP